MEDGGGNSLVEKKRDKLLRDVTILDLIADVLGYKLFKIMI